MYFVKKNLLILTIVLMSTAIFSACKTENTAKKNDASTGELKDIANAQVELLEKEYLENKKSQ